MPEESFCFDDHAHKEGQYELATRQVVFGVDFGDDDSKSGAVYEFLATDEKAEAFRQVMDRFMEMSRRVDKIALPRIPNNGGRLATLRRQRQQINDDLVPKALTATPAAPTVIPAEDVPDGFWQTRQGVTKGSDEGRAMIQLRADIREWAVAQGLMNADSLGTRGKIPSDAGIAFGQAHPDRIPRVD